MTPPPVGPHDRMGHTARQLIPLDLARELEAARLKHGLSLRQAGRLLDIDWSYLRRLCRGERCPSREVAERLIWGLDLDPEVAEELREAAVDRSGQSRQETGLPPDDSGSGSDVPPRGPQARPGRGEFLRCWAPGPER